MDNSHVRFKDWGCSQVTESNLSSGNSGPMTEIVGDGFLSIHSGAGHYRGLLELSTPGTLVLALSCPRPLRVWVDGALILDESLHWRSFQREVQAAIVLPVVPSDVRFDVEVGVRPRHPEHIDENCPSRNRKYVLERLAELHPDQIRWKAHIPHGELGASLGLRFLPTQFVRDGILWQHVLVRRGAGLSLEAPSVDVWEPGNSVPARVYLQSDLFGQSAELSALRDEANLATERWYVPVADVANPPAPLREVGVEDRPEPVLKITRQGVLTIRGPRGMADVSMPVYETLGRRAPHREFREESWPDAGQVLDAVPIPILPDTMKGFVMLYETAWKMLLNLVRYPSVDSGLPGSYISTGSKFVHHQFVWDTSFTALCTAYGHRVLSTVYSSMDLLYRSQFDGGYIHRETDVRDGLPVLYEPDFSPNPPIMSVVERAIAGLTGNIIRLKQVYPVLRDCHEWIRANRRLPDGTYWTTGLANGLDNSPSLGDGYPCITAQMAHDAETLADIASIIGLEEDSAKYLREYEETRIVLNQSLWNAKQRIYSTSLAGGGHNPNKVVTAFWPLWAGIVPEDRVQDLAMHAMDPNSFWRHHPLPSLAADSPYFVPEGQYWLGSTWAPTNYAAISGFDRSGRHDVAFDIAVRHLTCMLDVLEETGFIWENYCSESSLPGSVSMKDYSWSALGPIALLFEVIIGVRVDAILNVVRWTPPKEGTFGVRRFPFASANVDFISHGDGENGRRLEIQTDRPFRLEVYTERGMKQFDVEVGRSRFLV